MISPKRGSLSLIYIYIYMGKCLQINKKKCSLVHSENTTCVIKKTLNLTPSSSPSHQVLTQLPWWQSGQCCMVHHQSRSYTRGTSTEEMEKRQRERGRKIFKKEILQDTIKPNMLHGFECGQLRNNIPKMSIAEMRMLRWIIGNTLKDRIQMKTYEISQR